MTKIGQSNALLETTIYQKANQPAVFRRSREQWGEFSNMTGGFPITVAGTHFQSSEGLYQALKFPHAPQRQARIANARSGYDAKMFAYERGEKPCEEWDEQRIDAMRVALAFKLVQNPRLAHAIRMTHERDIVESSARDPFWGAQPRGSAYAGCNVLGKLLMELRDQLVKHTDPDSAAQSFAAEAFKRQFSVRGVTLTPQMLTSSKQDISEMPF